MGRGCGGKRGLASAAHHSPSSPDTPQRSAAPRARQSHIHAPRGARGRERPPAAGRGGSHPTGTHPCHSLRARGEHPWGGCACWLPGRVCGAGALGRDECPKEPSCCPAQGGIAPTAATSGQPHRARMTSIWGDGAMGRTSPEEQGKPTPKVAHGATLAEEQEHPSNRRIPCNPKRP